VRGRGFCRRRPFRAFLIEFTSGAQLLIGHPEAGRNEADIYAMRGPDGGYVVFAAEGVSRLLDLPTASAGLTQAQPRGEPSVVPKARLGWITYHSPLTNPKGQ